MYEVYVASLVRGFVCLPSTAACAGRGQLLTLVDTPACSQVERLAGEDGDGGRSRNPMLLVYRCMMAFYRVDALATLGGAKVTTAQMDKVEAQARERFQALLVRFLTTHRPTCMPTFTSKSWQSRTLVSWGGWHREHRGCRPEVPTRLPIHLLQAVSMLAYDDAQEPVLTLEASCASVVNAAEQRFWAGRRLAAAATTDE